MILLQRPKKNQPQSSGLDSSHMQAYSSGTAAGPAESSKKAGAE
jgi:hypothetical protein